MEIRLEDVPARRIGSLPHRGAYSQIGQVFPFVGQIAAAAGLAQETMAAVYYDHPGTTPEAELRSAAAVVLPEGTPCPNGLEESELPAGKYLVAVYVGSYEGLNDAWTTVTGTEMERRGLNHSEGPAYEIYENSGADVPESELRTAIHVSVA